MTTYTIKKNIRWTISLSNPIKTKFAPQSVSSMQFKRKNSGVVIRVMP